MMRLEVCQAMGFTTRWIRLCLEIYRNKAFVVVEDIGHGSGGHAFLNRYRPYTFADMGIYLSVYDRLNLLLLVAYNNCDVRRRFSLDSESSTVFAFL